MANRMTGMTLIEVLITVAIAGIILAWGLPNLADYVRTSRVVSTTNELVAALTAARTFAVSRSVQTVICASSNGISCTASTTWGSGWMVFEDCDGDNTLDTSAVTCADGSRPETVVRVVQYTSATTAIQNEPGNATLGYAATGIPSATGLLFSVCATPIPKTGNRTITLNAVGQATVGHTLNSGACS